MNLLFLVSGFSSFESGLELLKLILICVVMIFASYYVSKKIGSSQIGVRKDSNFKIIDAVNIGQGKYLQLVKVGKEKYVVIAVSKENITLITELSPDEVMEYQTLSENNSFKSVLMGVIKKKNAGAEIEDNDNTSGK